MNSKIGLYEFLIEAELQQYYNAIKNDLKVQNVSQIKYVTDDDLQQVGMSRPEIRRLKKYFNKHHPQTVKARLKKLLTKRDDTVASLSSSSQNVPGRSRNVPPGRHIIQADSIVIHKTIGSGEFGEVQQGVWTNDDGQRIQVAIKCLSRMENNPVEFLKEAAIMHQVDHEHIVRLFGVVLDTSALMLVTELAPLRSLLECLKEPSMKPNLTVPILFDFAVQINEGMQYLSEQRLIHRDLASRNILVFSKNKVKISDFGLSRALGVGKDYYQTNFNFNLKLPIAWCAPECINYLRFTSASDVWAYATTLWELFSYGFQPWAAFSGQQILEAIDEPNYQRLEKPECCPNDIYYQIMLKCWQHEPFDRPTFSQLANLLTENKPESVQAIRDYNDMMNRKDYLSYEAGELITVLDKMPSGGNEDGIILWKGVLKSGKTGLFHPTNTITYLGSSLPCVKQSTSTFTRSDSKSSSMRKGKISVDMISGPQGDLKHVGHVGAEGQFFGDIGFLGSTKSWLPKQVVSPYKPEVSSCSSDNSISTPVSKFQQPFSSMMDHQDFPSSDTAPLLSSSHANADNNGNIASGGGGGGIKNKIVCEETDTCENHEYHEISDEENEMISKVRELGLSNPALSSKSVSPLDSPRFGKSFDLGGPSLMDEVFNALDDNAFTDEANVKNELREMARTKKKFATVKPISSSDRKTLDHAIAIANELASRSMDLENRPGKHSNNSLDDISSSPRTPNSPSSHKRKFSFILGANKNDKGGRRNFSQETASISDIQYSLSEEAKQAYNSLIDKPTVCTSMGFLTPSFENKSFNFPEKTTSKKSELFQLPCTSSSINNIHMSCNSSSSASTSNTNTNFKKPKSRNSSLSNMPEECNSNGNSTSNGNIREEIEVEEKVEEEVVEAETNPLRLLRLNKSAGLKNVLPLPPRSNNLSASNSNTSRHQRKHPLLFPSIPQIQINNNTQQHTSRIETMTMAPPPPPPKKPLRQIQKLELAAQQQQQQQSTSKQVVDLQSQQENTDSQPNEAKKENSESHPNSMIPSNSNSFSNINNNLTNTNANNNVRSLANTFERGVKIELDNSIPMYENYATDDEGSLQIVQVQPDENDKILMNGLNQQHDHEQQKIQNEVIHSTNSFMNKNKNSIASSSGSGSTNASPSMSTSASTATISIAGSANSSRRNSLENTIDLPKPNPIIENEKGRYASSTNAMNTNTNSSSSSSPSTISCHVQGKEFEIRPFKSANLNESFSPSQATRSSLNLRKIGTLKRILGSNVTDEECTWSLDNCKDDCSHAVKLLRLKALLPESLLKNDIERVISVLEMSHWDIIRASEFLLTKTPKGSIFNSSSSSSRISRGEMNGNISDNDYVPPTAINNSNNNNDSLLTNDYIGPSNNNSNSSNSNIRPTRV